MSRFASRARRQGALGRASAGVWLLVAALLAPYPRLAEAAEGPGNGPVHKTARDEAANRFRRGVELFKDGDYQAALIEFRRAYELVPNYAVLYNIGQVEWQLQDYADALTTFERYLAEGGRQIPAARRAEVERDIEKLKTRIAQIEISINVPDAELSIDDVPVAKGSLNKPLTVSAGRHKVTASRDGYFPATRVVDIASNDTVKLTIELIERAPRTQQLPAESATKPREQLPSPPDDAAEPRARQSVPPTPALKQEAPFPWAGWAVTGALAAGAATFGVLALDASSELGDRRKRFGIDPAELNDASTKTVTLAAVADALLAASMIAGGVTLFFTVRSLSPPANEATAHATPTVRIGLAPSGIRVLGAF